MKNGLRKVTTLALAIVLMTTTLLPMNAFAKSGITNADFEAAKATPGIVTDKGIIYESDGDFYSLEPGEYVLAEDIIIEGSYISIDNPGEYIFDLNGKNLSRDGGLSGFIYFDNGKITIKGNGSISNVDESWSVLSLRNCETIIENGNFNGVVTSYSTDKDASLTINDATIRNTLWIKGNNTTAVINKGNFYSDVSNALLLSDGASLVINDGTFSGGTGAVTADNDNGTKEKGISAKSLVINGGTFTSRGDSPYIEDIVGTLFLKKVDNVVLNGGSFIAEGNSLGAIVIPQVTDADKNQVFNNILGDGYKFSDELVISDVIADEKASWATQNSISVISKIADNTSKEDNTTSSTSGDSTSTKVRAPKTGDEAPVALLAFVVLGASIVGLSVYRRRN